MASSAPIHKSSSTGSFSLGSSSSSSSSLSFHARASQPDRSASFSYSAPIPSTPTSSSSILTFGPSGSFGKSQVTSGSTPPIFSFGSKGGESKSGSTPGQTFPFVAPKAVPASSSLASSDTNFSFKAPAAKGFSEQGKPLQQPASSQATPGCSPSQPAQSSDHLKSQYPLSASASAFSISHQKTSAGGNSLFGGSNL